MSRILNAFRQIKFKDLLAPFIFLILLIPSFVFRLINKAKHRKLWLVAEQGEARDNGYHFYKYVRINHPADFCFYAIKKDSAGYKKVAELGNVIKWGSLKHWLYYMSANLNISSQKSGNPCPIFWYVMHVTFGLYRNRVFLQHGVIHNDSKWVYKNKARFKKFVCSSKDEYDFILKNFGYKEQDLILSGLARWDNLVIKKKRSGCQNKTILIMPTWRNWLGGERNRLSRIVDFKKTDYYKCWNGLLNDDEFIRYVEENGIRVLFCLHINMLDYTSLFNTKSDNIEIILPKDDIQELFNESDLMLTDYSSVAFEFGYLQKPVIYYQFDYDAFRSRQHEEGYFRYERDGFGPVVYSKKELLGSIKKVLLGNEISKYSERFKRFDVTRDIHNAQRIYNALKESDQTKKQDRLDELVSIIVPVYNSEKTIERCYRQLSIQNYPNLEFIIIDDGSNDATRAMLSSYLENDDRLRIIETKHLGPNNARFVGLKNSLGKYVLFVDSDDFIVENTVSTLVDAIKRNKVDVVRFNGLYYPTNNIVNPVLKKGEKSRILKQPEIMWNALNTYALSCLWLQFYKREDLMGIEAFKTNLSYGEDYCINVEKHSKTRRLLAINDVLYCYCDNKDSITKNQNKEKIINRIKDRIVASQIVCNSLSEYSDSFRNKAVISQMKMIRNTMMELSRIKDYGQNELSSDFSELLSRNGVLLDDSLKLALTKMSPIDKFKNKRIVEAIINADCSYIYRYIDFWKRFLFVKNAWGGK